MPKDEIADRALAAARSEPRVGPHFRPTLLEVDEQGAATIEGEAENVAVKRIALERVAATPGISGIIDRLHVRPASVMSDAGIRDHLRKAYAQDAAFRGLRIVERVAGENRTVQDAPPEPRGEIVVEVENGIVTLNGAVPSLAAKRLAGVLAWWVQGSRDVVNGIAVETPEEDAPIRIEEAVRAVLDKDPFVDSSQVRVGARERTVRLSGLVKSDSARNMAEWDAWYVFGVDDVVNDIAVRA